MKQTLRNRFDHYLRKKRKNLTKLSPCLSDISEIIELAVTRPVDIFRMSEHFIAKKEDDSQYLDRIYLGLDELLENRKTFQEAANIFVSVLRALRTLDEQNATDFGEKFIHKIQDERALKTLVALYISLNQREKAISTIELSSNIPWTKKKKIALLNSEVSSMTREQHFVKFRNISYNDSFCESILFLYADVNMNVIDGSSIWLASITEALANHSGEIHLLLKANISRETVLEPLLSNNKITIFEPLEFGIHDGELDIVNAVKIIEMLDGIYGGYKRIILRGFNLCTIASSTKSLHGRIWAYLTDYYEIDDISGQRNDKKGVSELIPDFINHFDRFLTQTEEIRNDLIERHNIPLEMFSLAPPMIPPASHSSQPSDEIKNEIIKIGYAGKIAPEWGVRELINIADIASERNLKLQVHIIGDKIHRNTPTYPSFHEDMRELLKTNKNVVWHGGLSRKETIQMMSGMDICWGYRSKLLEDNTLELSTKTLEYLSLGLPTIISRNSINENICGLEYPFFIDTGKDIFEQAIAIIEQSISSPPKPSDLQVLVEDHTIERVWNLFLSPLVQSIERQFTEERRRIVINGHDFKFIAEFESHLKKLGHDVRRDQWGWGEAESFNRSKKLALWSEIIFSEWGLANAAWYSQNISSNQSHFIRIHLQEINERARKFPPKIDLDFVNQILFVSEHVCNTAIDMFSWPKEKCSVIHNYVNTDLFDNSKNKDAEFTIAIAGIVPQRKRLDRALDLMRSLRMKDKRWNLVIKGRLPHDYSFMHAEGRREELIYFEEQYHRIEIDDHLKGAVTFENYTPSLANWYKSIGYILSPSDFESFHYSIAEGVASGCVPIIWPWEGVNEFYPAEWVGEIHKQLVEMAININRRDPDVIESNKAFIRQKYSMDIIFMKLLDIMVAGK